MNIIVSLFSFKDIFTPKFLDKILSLILLLILILFTGLRFKVGGDWGPYELIYDQIKTSNYNFFTFFKNLDSLFYLLNYLVSLIGLKHGLILVNLIVSAFVFICFYRFIFANYLNFTSFIIFFPYVVIVLMGYTRQSVVLGFLFLILSLDLDKKKLSTIILALISGFFHFSGYFLSFIIFNNFTKKINKDSKFFTFLIPLIMFLIVMLFIYFNLDRIIDKYNYFQKNFTTTSSLIRNFPIFFSCLLFLNFRKYFKNNIKNYNFYFKLSILGILLYFSTFLFSTLSDRLLIFLIPLCVLVFSKLLNYFRSNSFKFIYLFSLNIFFVFFLLGWFNFSNSGKSWLPYDILLEPKHKFFNSFIEDVLTFEFTYEEN